MSNWQKYGLTKQYLLCTIPFMGYAFGAWLQRIEDLRLTRFRDKSALYGRPENPPSEPSWP